MKRRAAWTMGIARLSALVSVEAWAAGLAVELAAAGEREGAPLSCRRIAGCLDCGGYGLAVEAGHVVCRGCGRPAPALARSPVPKKK